jgi:hypothetical protein
MPCLRLGCYPLVQPLDRGVWDLLLAYLCRWYSRTHSKNRSRSSLQRRTQILTCRPVESRQIQNLLPKTRQSRRLKSLRSENRLRQCRGSNPGSDERHVRKPADFALLRRSSGMIFGAAEQMCGVSKHPYIYVTSTSKRLVAAWSRIFSCGRHSLQG